MYIKTQTYIYIINKVQKINNAVIIIIIYLYGSTDRGASISEYLFYVFHVHYDNEESGKTTWTTE
jgi:hypothetical protein